MKAARLNMTNYYARQQIEEEAQPLPHVVLLDAVLDVVARPLHIVCHIAQHLRLVRAVNHVASVVALHNGVIREVRRRLGPATATISNARMLTDSHGAHMEVQRVAGEHASLAHVVQLNTRDAPLTTTVAVNEKNITLRPH